MSFLWYRNVWILHVSSYKFSLASSLNRTRNEDLGTQSDWLCQWVSWCYLFRLSWKIAGLKKVPRRAYAIWITEQLYWKEKLYFPCLSFLFLTLLFVGRVSVRVSPQELKQGGTACCHQRSNLGGLSHKHMWRYCCLHIYSCFLMLLYF